MSGNGNSNNDTGETLRTILSRRDLSLVSELTAIQRHANEVEKAQSWDAISWCLEYDELSPYRFRRVWNQNLEAPFVAVSWTWEPSRNEDAAGGDYSVASIEFDKAEESKIRNCVFDRIVKYLKSVDIKTFWIDGECVDQDNEERKAQAINSMDIVYRRAEKSVGILSTPIRSRTGLHLFERLIGGELSRRTSDNRCEFLPKVRSNTIIQVIRILRTLTADSWWKRAWIFQEEYLSGMHMDLLIPLATGLEDRNSSVSMPSEFCVSATDLREQATIFLLACLRKGEKEYRRYQRSCEKMLEIVGKYNILLQQNRIGPESMSARISADVLRRDITQPWDALAIVANACSYKIRLDKPKLVQENRSLTLSLLAQFLLNGEIMMSPSDSSEDDDEDDDEEHAWLDVDIITLLQDISLNDADVPVKKGKLTFLKNCRLPSVQFCDTGMLTRGFIWNLHDDERSCIHTSRFEFQPSSNDLEARPWEAVELMRLADMLERKEHPALRDKLCAYIDRGLTGSDSPATTYMDLMAWDVVKAIQRGFVLRIGYLHHGGGGIFVPIVEDVNVPMQVLTTWLPREFDGGELDSFLSLKVVPKPDETFAVDDWINGLVFFYGKKPQPVVLGWPQCWTSKLV